MYRPEDLVKAVNEPRKVTAKLVGLHGRAMNAVFGGNRGEYVLDQDWDNLIILDACRYDIFAECNTIDGNLRRFHSRGSHTGEFMEQNFQGGTYSDVVYVSSNPNPASVDAKFAAVEEVWQASWDDELHTVPPETMVERTIAAESAYPHKRLISHFLQPHYPWIGPEGREYMEEFGFMSQHAGNEHIWLKLERGERDPERVWHVYRENLLEVLPHVQRLAEELNGKTVITSDHGNAFGE
jgi:hypothetical protein